MNTQKKTAFVLTIAIAAILLLILLIMAGVGTGSFNKSHLPFPDSHLPKELRLGVPLLVIPVYVTTVAEEEGFFTRNGLNVSIHLYESGHAATDAVDRGDIDLAFAAEFALAQHALEHLSIQGIGSISKGEMMYLVGRRDRGVGFDPKSLSGKQIGVPLRTVSEFYLNRYLVIHGMDPGTVSIKDLSRSGQVEAIMNGSVDAVVTAEPYLSEMRARLGNSLEVLPVQSSQYTYVVAIGRKAWIMEQSDTLIRFMRSIDEAESYIRAHPKETRQNAMQRLKMDEKGFAKSLDGYDLTLSIDPSLIIAMEDEARWLIRNNLTNETSVPDFRDYISTDLIGQVRPEAIQP